MTGAGINCFLSFDNGRMAVASRGGNMSSYNLSFEGRIAIVTGAGRGLGRAYAIGLAKRGAKVVVNDLESAPDDIRNGSSGPANVVASEIRQMGGAAVANYDNVATPEGGANIVKTAVDAFGKLDILINNAGILKDKSLINLEPEDWDKVIEVNLKGAYCVTRPALKIMKDNNYGRIIMTTSTAAIFGNFGQANYAAAKLGLIGLMNILKIEGAKYNIKVNTISPTAVTRLTESITPPDLAKKQNIDCVVPMVIFLCSDQNVESGNIYYAGMGIYRRIALVSGPGMVLGDAENPASAENIMANFEKINSLKDAKTYPTSADYAKDVYKAMGDTLQISA